MRWPGLGLTLFLMGTVITMENTVCLLAGFLAAPLGGLPLFIHVPLWIAGLEILRATRTPLEVSG